MINTNMMMNDVVPMMTMMKGTEQCIHDGCHTVNAWLRLLAELEDLDSHFEGLGG